jgi:hypothetical protein
MGNQFRLNCIAVLFVASYVVFPRVAISQGNCGIICTCADCPNLGEPRHDGRWFVLDTANFQVCAESSTEPVKHLARHAESVRKFLQMKWLGQESTAAWSPRCQIVLYANQRRYVAAVGRGSERTVGSSLVKENNGRVTIRRIDLLGGATEYLSAALPHEMTHVILADRFPGNNVPRWADEGMALLADTDAKQDRHRKELLRARTSHSTFGTAELLTMETYPSSTRLGAFYGQSASLTSFLVDRRGPQHFLSFIEKSNRLGYDTALRECYEIDGMSELDRQCRREEQSLPLASGGDLITAALSAGGN